MKSLAFLLVFYLFCACNSVEIEGFQIVKLYSLPPEIDCQRPYITNLVTIQVETKTVNYPKTLHLGRAWLGSILSVYFDCNSEVVMGWSGLVRLVYDRTGLFVVRPNQTKPDQKPNPTQPNPTEP